MATESIAGRFEIERLAGIGGMGSVYRALDRQSGGPVALKLLHVGGADAEERFLREARLLADLRHPGIVRYLAHGRAPDGRLYLAIEWLEGEDLAQRLARGPLTVDEAVAVVAAAADAAGAAHARGVIHRDIKPSNLFLVDGRTDRIKLLDFGVARRAELSSTRTGQVLGTPAYMAPEQARGAATVDARADVFSLGSVLFECLAGQPPFRAEHPMALVAKILLEEAPRVGELRADAPAAIDLLVARMLAKLPAARPPDGAAVARELRIGLAERAAAGTDPFLPALTAGERRLISVVVARPGAAGAAGLGIAATLAPGDLPAPPAALVAAAGDGRLIQLADGGVLVVLEGAGAATDQAAQAARAALALLAHRPDAPIALATGHAEVVARPVGEVIDRAVELSGRAVTGAVRIDEVTAGLLDLRFQVDVDDRDGEPAGGLLLRGEREAPPTVRMLCGRPTPFVGRERELSTLLRLYEECVADPAARVVLVTAEAGVGKSRLRYEFTGELARRREVAEVWIGRADAIRAGSPFGMLAQLVRWQAGVRDGEAAVVSRRKLTTRISRHLAGDDLARAAEFLAELIGAGPVAGSVRLAAARRDPRLMGDQIRRAWQEFLAAECAARPVVLVLEDLHWGDLPTASLVDGALSALADRPLFVLALARPDVHDVLPKLWADRGLLELRLARLGKRASEELARHVLGAAASAHTVGRIVDTAAGNAFFLEELIRATAEGKDAGLPHTVLAMVQTRLEGMEPEARRLLRAASVFGQMFWRDGLLALLGDEPAASVDAWLAALVDREVVAPLADGRFAHRRAFVFRHALVRDAAYSMLTDDDRGLGHRLAAAWLEQVGEVEARLLAEHWERGGQPRRAVVWYRRAAEQALEGNDLAGAIARAERGVACGAGGEALAALRSLEAEAHIWRSEWAAVARCGEEGMGQVEAGSPLWGRLADQLARACGVLADSARLERLADEVADLAPDAAAPADLVLAAGRTIYELLQAGRPERAHALHALVEARAAPADADPVGGAMLARMRGYWHSFQGELETAARFIDAAAERFAALGDLRTACLLRNNLGDNRLRLGDFAGAEAALAIAVADAERLGLDSIASLARMNVGWAQARRGDPRNGLPLVERSGAEFAARGEPRMAAAAHEYASAIQLGRGDAAAAEREARAGLALAAPFPLQRAPLLARLALALLARGAAVEALATAREAAALLAELGTVGEGDAAVRLSLIEALTASGDSSELSSALASARAELLATAARLHDPVTRAQFLAVPEHARLLDF